MQGRKAFHQGPVEVIQSLDGGRATFLFPLDMISGASKIIRFPSRVPCARASSAQAGTFFTEPPPPLPVDPTAPEALELEAQKQREKVARELARQMIEAAQGRHPEAR
jgi:hypothetical protein